MNRPARLALSAAAFLFLAGPALAEDYAIDSEGMHANIGFQAKHLGFSWLVGRFDTFNGSFTFDEKNPGASKVVVDIDATSINSNHTKRDAHLRSADFFDVANHPGARFESTAIEVTGEKTGVIRGNLTIRGVTKEVAIEAEHIGGGKDPWGGYRNGFRGTTQIVPAEFGMPHAVAAFPVYLTLDVEGIRK